MKKRKKGRKGWFKQKEKRSTDKVLRKRHLRASMVALTCRMMVEDCEFKSILGFRVRP